MKAHGAKTRRAVAALLSVALLCALVAIPTGAVLAQGTSLSIDPPAQSVTVGQSFTVGVVIDTAEASRGAQCALDFDPAVLQCDDVVEGTFFSDWADANGCDTVLYPIDIGGSVIDNVTGHVDDVGVAIVGTANPGGPTGSGVFLAYEFTAVGIGTSALTLGNVQAFDVDANPVLVTSNDGEVTASAVAQMKIDPPTQTIDGAQSFDVTVVVETTVESRGAQCALTFDPAVAECTGYDVGTFYSDWASANGCSIMEYPSPVIDNNAGTISDIGIAIMGLNPGGPTGSGSLVTYHFNAIGGGTSAMTLGNVEIADADSYAIPGVVVTDGEVTAEFDTSVSVDPATQHVDPSDTFDITIVVDTDTASRGAQCAVSFNPAAVQCDGYDVGTFYSDWASANGCSIMEYPSPVIDNNAGTISDIGIAIMGLNPGGPTGSGSLVTYHFTALTDGVSPITLSNVSVADVDSFDIPGVIVNDGEVTVGEPPQPDLIVASVTATTIGGVEFEIQNVGGAAAGASTACVYIDGEHQTGCDVAVPALNAGESSGTLQSACQFQWGCGDNVVTVRADNNDDVAESNENNNENTDTVFQDCANLVVTGMSWDWVVEDSEYTVSFKVQNIGGEFADPSTAALSVDAVEVETFAVGGLNPGEESGEFTSAAISLTTGEDVADACADSQSEVDETNEGDNCASVTVSTAKCDLTIEDFYIESGGETEYSVWFRVKNISPDTPAPGSTAGIYIDGAVALTQAVDPLAAGAESTLFKLGPFTVTDETDTIEVIADYDTVVPETDETNNSSGEDTYPGGGCFIASAAFGSYLDDNVDALRGFRDGYLGDGFVSAYYSVSPAIAEFIDDNPALKPAVQAALMPAVGASSVATDTNTAQKASVAGGMALVTVLLAAWVVRRQRNASSLS